MGNKMCCFCRREEDHSEEEIRMEKKEEIEMQILDESEIPEESRNDTSDSPDYVEMREHSQPIYISMLDLTDSLKDDAPETFRLRIMAEHYYDTKLELCNFYDTTVPMNSALNSEDMECLFHISVYKNQKERIMDLTYINDLKTNSMNQYVMYWKNLQEDSWTLNYSSDDSLRSFQQCQISSVRKVLLWATTTHVKKDTEVYKLLFLSKRPATVVVPSHIKQSAGYVVHLTAYNAQLTRTLDLVLIYGKNAQFNSECYVHFRDPKTDITREFRISAPDDVGPSGNIFS